jgi:hypothetical protein
LTHSLISATTLSVIQEMVSWNTVAPYTRSAAAAATHDLRLKRRIDIARHLNLHRVDLQG